MNKETETPDVTSDQSTDHDTRSDIDRELERVESIEVELRGEGEQGEAKASVAPADEAPVKAPAPKASADEPAEAKEVLVERLRREMHKQPAQKQKKGSSGLVAILAVLVIGLLGLVGWLVFDKMRVDSELSNARQSLSAKEGQISSLSSKSSNSSMDTKEVAKPSAPVADSVYRTIPEWGVRYKVADIEKDKDVTYAFSIGAEGSDLLGVRSVTTARTVKNPGVYADNDYACGNPEQSIGHIIRMTADQYNQSMKDFNASGNPLSSVGDAMKVGDMYYLYRRSQGMSCTQTSPPSQKFKEHADKWQSYGKYIEDSVVKKLELIK